MSDDLDPRLLRVFAESAEHPDSGAFTAAVANRVATARRTRRTAWAAALIGVLALAAWAAPYAIGLSRDIVRASTDALQVAGGGLGAAGALALAVSVAALACLAAWRVMRRQ